jgi:hypothetical protein
MGGGFFKEFSLYIPKIQVFETYAWVNLKYIKIYYLQLKNLSWFLLLQLKLFLFNL